MKYFVILTLFSHSAWGITSSVKFRAKTNGPGISVEGEVKESQVQTDFKNLQSATFSTDVMNLTTGMEKRDKHLQEKVFQVHKTGMAKIEYILSAVNCPTTVAESVECECKGNLKIKDVSNEINFIAVLNKKKQEIEGKAIISLAQFKLTAPTFMGINVLDDVEVLFHVSAN